MTPPATCRCLRLRRTCQPIGYWRAGGWSPHCRNTGSGFQMLGLGLLVHGCATQRVGVAAIGFGTGHDVIAPRHRVLVKKVGQIRPREDRTTPMWMERVTRPRRGCVQGVLTAARIMPCADRGPL